MSRKILPLKGELHFRIWKKEKWQTSFRVLLPPARHRTSELRNEVGVNPLWHYKLVKLYKEGRGKERPSLPCSPYSHIVWQGTEKRCVWGGGGDWESQKGTGREGSTLVSVIILPIWGERELGGDTGFIWGGKHYLVQFHTLGVPLPAKIKPVGVLPWRWKHKASTLRFVSSLTFSQTSKGK